MTRRVPQQLARLLKSRLNRFIRNIDGVERGDIEPVHRVRVASRRMRELIPVLQIDSTTTRKLVRRLRKVTRRLGVVRDHDVLLLLIDELNVSRPVHQVALRRVRAEVAAERDAARKRLRNRLSTASLQRLGRKLNRVCDDLRERSSDDASDDGRPVAWAIDARIARRATALHDAMNVAGAVYLPERLHDVRIASKKLRYALELAEQIRGTRNTPPVRALKRVQGLLGRVHDVQVLIERVREAQARLAPASLPAWRELNDLVASLEDMCRRLHARYVRERATVEALIRRRNVAAAGVRARAERKAG